jgi:hypothetical protein
MFEIDALFLRGLLELWLWYLCFNVVGSEVSPLLFRLVHVVLFVGTHAAIVPLLFSGGVTLASLSRVLEGRHSQRLNAERMVGLAESRRAGAEEECAVRKEVGGFKGSRIREKAMRRDFLG